MDGEQNPTNKFEPKFKAGDYIINKYGFIMQIDEIDGNIYVYHVLDDNHILKYDITKTENSCHLWTIQDAKDCDVLANDTSIIIFKKIGNYAWNDVVDYYVGYCHSLDKINIQSGKSHYGNINTVTFKPATKEQRDLLFQKMKEAGYEWDAEKKELKKIKQISNWNEEDEKGLGDTLWAIKQARTIAKDENDMGNLWYAENWLKSIKERIKEE